MNKAMLAGLTLLYSGGITGCAHTYNMPEAEPGPVPASGI
jgi:hypothetical protein